MSNVTALRPAADPITSDAASTGFDDVPPLMSPKTLASVLEVTTVTLQRWRDDGRGPAWSEIPGSNVIRYSRADLLAWLTEHRVTPAEVQS